MDYKKKKCPINKRNKNLKINWNNIKNNFNFKMDNYNKFYLKILN